MPTTLPPLSRRLLLSAALASISLPGAAAQAQSWPSRPIKLIVPFPAGGGTDTAARMLAERLSQALGANMVIENRPGAGTIIGASAVTKAPADGHTLLLSGSSTFTVNPAVRRNLPYDPFTQLEMLGMVARAPLVIVTGASGPYASMAQFIADAKARPGALNYATFGAGTGPHLVGEMLAYTRGIQLQDVPYKGSADAAVAVLRGDVQIGIDTIAAAKGQIQEGKMRALAVVSTKRTPLMPNVPSLRELGLDDALFDAWYALAAPAGLDKTASARLQKALQGIVSDPDFKRQMARQSMDAAWLSPADLRALMAKEVVRYRAVVARSSIPQS